MSLLFLIPNGLSSLSKAQSNRSYSVPKTLGREWEDTAIHCYVKNEYYPNSTVAPGVGFWWFATYSTFCRHAWTISIVPILPHCDLIDRQWSVVLEWHKCRYVPIYRSRVALHNIHLLWFDCFLLLLFVAVVRCGCLLRLLWNTRTALPGERLTSTGTTSTVVS